MSNRPSRRVLTYGTFDLLHFGHMRLLRRLAGLGDHVMVGLSTDGFNALKGKKAEWSYERRRRELLATGLVDLVFPEDNWEQKPADVRRLHADLFAMGDDWAGHFDFLREWCDVSYLSRTPGISSTLLRQHMRQGTAS